MKAENSFHSCLAPDLKRYISLKQALGRQFQNASSILLNLDQFLCAQDRPSADLTPETFKQWAQTMESLCSNTRLARMRLVRNFCLYRRRTAPGCFVPDPTQFPQSGPTVQPYIFSDQEVERLLGHSDFLSNTARSPLRGAATRLAIVLLYTTGIRRGELLRLTPRDYDPSARTLLIRVSKFYKSRLLPLPGDVASEVDKFLQFHRAVGLAAEVPLLCGPYKKSDRAYSSFQLRKNLGLLLSLAQIKKTMAVYRAFTISVLASPLTLCFAGIEMETTSKPSCLTWLLGWATFQSSRLIITCALSSRCVHLPAIALPIAIVAW